MLTDLYILKNIIFDTAKKDAPLHFTHIDDEMINNG